MAETLCASGLPKTDESLALAHHCNLKRHGATTTEMSFTQQKTERHFTGWQHKCLQTHVKVDLTFKTKVFQ